MTELGVSEDFQSYLKTSVDMMGKTTAARTALTDHRTPALYLAHSFGPLQVSGSLADLAHVEARLNTDSVPAVLSVSVTSSIGATYRDPNQYYDSQSFSLDHKVHVSPGRFAMFCDGGVSLIEESSTLDTGMRSSGHLIYLFAGTTAELQLTRRLGIYVSADFGAPASQSSSMHFGATLSPSVELLIAAFRTWDFYAHFGLVDVTRTPLPSLSVGFAKRWGS